MSVLECNRSGCGNILCDRYSYKYGYICDECFGELVQLGPQTDINDFMNGDVDYIDLDASQTYFDSIFPKNNE